MARARNIKPGFFKNEDLAECSLAARLCFAGLWTLADREGRLEDRPKRIKGELFPFDSFEVEPLLVELVQFGFIVRYEVDGQRCIQVSKFAEHQTPHYSEKASAIKPPALQESRGHQPGVDSGNQGVIVGASLQEDSGNGGLMKRMSQPPDSLIPDSLNPESPTPPRKRGQVHEFPPGFERVWSAYPKKVGKDTAAKAFAKRKPDAALVEAMVRAIEAQRASRDWTKDGGQYVPHLATWLNQGRWMDETGAPATGIDDVFAGAR